jgi:hypothetical protein
MAANWKANQRGVGANSFENISLKACQLKMEKGILKIIKGQKLDSLPIAKISSVSATAEHFNNSISISSSSNSPFIVPFHERYRKYIGLLLPAIFMQLVWWTLAIRYNLFRLYPTRYPMAITMIFGATIAGKMTNKFENVKLSLGATSEGGGAVAFPVMTLLLHIDSLVARDFSLMIQSCGWNWGCKILINCLNKILLFI